MISAWSEKQMLHKPAKSLQAEPMFSSVQLASSHSFVYDTQAAVFSLSLIFYLHFFGRFNFWPGGGGCTQLKYIYATQIFELGGL